MRVIAIDPGYDRIGVAVLEKNEGKESLIFSDCITTPKGVSFHDRLSILTTSFKELCDKWVPEECAIEKLFFNTNQKTAMQVSEARGALIEAAHSSGLDVSEYTPMEIKVAVAGYGGASKAQVADMVKRLIKINHLPKYDDEFDAIACGLTHFATLKTK